MTASTAFSLLPDVVPTLHRAELCKQQDIT